MSPENRLPDMQLDISSLYREEVFTDQKTGSLRRMTPITATGEVDTSRPVMYAGQTQLMTPAGALPLAFEIEAEDLATAIAKYGDAAREALEQTMEELREMRRQQASSIVIPGQEPGGFGGMGGAMGGGKIRMP